MGKDPNQSRFDLEFATILTERDLTLDEIQEREHDVPIEEDFDTFAMYCGLRSDRAKETLTEAIMLDPNEMLTKAILPPAGLTPAMWKEEIMQDITLLELQLTLLLQEANIHDGFTTRDYMSHLTLEELLVRQQLRRLEVLKYRGNIEAQMLYDALDWGNTNEPYPVSCIPIDPFIRDGSTYSPWRSVHAVVWRIKDYENYQRDKLPPFHEIDLEEGEEPIPVERETYRTVGAGLSKRNFNNIVRIRPDRDAHTHLSWEAEVMQRRQEEMMNMGYWFHKYSTEELLEMKEDQLLSLVVYYRIAVKASDKDQASIDLWGRLDHNKEFPIRAIQVNGASLGMNKDRIRDKKNPRIPRFMRTYMIYGAMKR